jgi:hypothetical protein
LSYFCQLGAVNIQALDRKRQRRLAAVRFDEIAQRRAHRGQNVGFQIREHCGLRVRAARIG